MADIINGPELNIDYKVKKPDNYKKPDSEKKRRVWSTEMINQIISDYNDGYDIDYSPFFWNDIELRAENVSYDYTNEEVEEFDKCLNDPVYFIEKYCKFMTDFGYRPVKLRTFQKKLIRIICSQKSGTLNNQEILLPEHRNIIWMAARQSGKCLNFNQLIDIKEKDSLYESKSDFIYKIWNKYKKKNFLIFIKKLLYKIYAKL